MHGGREESESLIGLAVTGALGAILAALFHSIRVARAIRDTKFSTRHFAAGILSAGGAGALVAWMLDGLGVNHELAAVIIAMCGYTGGCLLDLIASELPNTIHAAFAGIQKRLSHGSWHDGPDDIDGPDE